MSAEEYFASQISSSTCLEASSPNHIHKHQPTYKKFQAKTYYSLQQSIIADLDSLLAFLKSVKIAPSRLNPNKVNTRILTRFGSPVLDSPSSVRLMALSSSETAPLATELSTSALSLPLEGHHETPLINADLNNNGQYCESRPRKNGISSRVSPEMTPSNGRPTIQAGNLSIASVSESCYHHPAHNIDFNCFDSYGTAVKQKSNSQSPASLVCIQSEKFLESSSESKAAHFIAMSTNQSSELPRVDSGEPLYCSIREIPIPVPLPFAIDRPSRTRNIESLLEKLRHKKVGECGMSNFIPIRAKATLQDPNDNSFPLLDQVDNFLESDNDVFLILGDAGSGKTFFCKHLDYVLWNRYKPGGIIPVLIDLPTINRPERDLIKKQLHNDGFSNVEIREMLGSRQFLLICDGYDGCGVNTNLHATNNLNRTGKHNVKMIVSCRTTLFGSHYQGRFYPHGADKYHDSPSDLFEEATIVPFTEEDIKAYIQQHIRDTANQDFANNRPCWTVEQFMDTFSTIIGLSDVVKNPFMLWLALRVLPSISSDALTSAAKIKATRAHLYDGFLENWICINESRISRAKLKQNVSDAYRDLCESEGGFKGSVTEFLINLSAAMFQHQGPSPVVDYVHVKEEKTWKGEYFGRKIKSILLRDASPLKRAGDQYRFIHDTFCDYFRSFAFYNSDRGEDDSSDDGEDDGSDDGQGDDSDNSEDDESDDGDEDDSGEGADGGEGDGGKTLRLSDCGLTEEGEGSPSGNYCSSSRNGGSYGGDKDTSGGNQGSTNKSDDPSGGDGDWSGGNGDATNGERGSNGRIGGSSGGNGGSGGNDNNSSGGRDGFKGGKNNPRQGKDGSRSKKKDRPTKFRPSTSSDPYSKQNVFKDPLVLEFLVDRVHSDPRFEKRLLSNIEQSKSSASPSLAAANSMTILYMAGERFGDINLDGVQVPYDYMLEESSDTLQRSGHLTGVDFVGALSAFGVPVNSGTPAGLLQPLLPTLFEPHHSNGTESPPSCSSTTRASSTPVKTQNHVDNTFETDLPLSTPFIHTTLQHYSEISDEDKARSELSVVEGIAQASFNSGFLPLSFPEVNHSTNTSKPLPPSLKAHSSTPNFNWPPFMKTQSSASTSQSHAFLQHKPQFQRHQVLREELSIFSPEVGSRSPLSPPPRIQKTDAVATKPGLYRDVVNDIQGPAAISTRESSPLLSPLLARDQEMPSIEDDLQRLRLQRLGVYKQPVYIAPMAKPSLQASDDTLSPLMDKVKEFLAGADKVMLIMGDSGAGKSTFNRHLEHKLWHEYRAGGHVPLFINLPTLMHPDKELVEEQLRSYDFSEERLCELKQNRRFVLICDGYDECPISTNHHKTDALNQAGQRDSKLLITCRTQYLGHDYRGHFVPKAVGQYQQAANDLFQEAVIAPFSKDQIEAYVERYVPLEPRTWAKQDYMDKLTVTPGLMGMVANPFLLTLALRALPIVAQGKADSSRIPVNRLQLYDIFVEDWLGVNKRRLRSMWLGHSKQQEFDKMQDDGFEENGARFQEGLAAAIFQEQDGRPLVNYRHKCDKNSWKAKFFGIDPKTSLLRDASMLSRVGNQYRFIHRSLQEYFYSRAIWDSGRNKIGPASQAISDSSEVTLGLADHPLSQRNLIIEPAILKFLSERVSADPIFKQRLQDIVELSKTDDCTTIAAANAMTILVRAGMHFNGADLRGIRICGADLSNGQFDSALLQGADLTHVNLARSWIRKADFRSAQMEGVRFGELPYLQVNDPVTACSYSPNGSMFAVATQRNGFDVFDTSTWTRRVSFRPLGGICSIAFSPDSERVVSGGKDKTVRLWDNSNGEKLMSMHGHCGTVSSVAFSPCGGRIASASHDKTLRLWDSQTGMPGFVFEGHSQRCTSVRFSPDARQLVSGCEEGTIRLWDVETGESLMCLRLSVDAVNCLAFSPDCGWVVSGHASGQIRLWSTATGEPNSVLRGHDRAVTGIAFSPNGQCIVSCSSDNTLKLWDVPTGSLVATLLGHSCCVSDVTFSPDGRYIASGGFDSRVRLWNVESIVAGTEVCDPHSSASIVAYSPDGQTVISLNGRTVHKWNSLTGTVASASKEPSGFESIESLMVFSDGLQMAVCMEDGSIFLHNVLTETAGLVLRGHSCRVSRVAFSPCRRWLASADRDNTVRVSDLQDGATGCILAKLTDVSDGSIKSIAFAPTGFQLAIGSLLGTVNLFDLKSSQQVTFKALITGGIRILAYSPDGKRIAIVSDASIHLWDLQSNTCDTKLDIRQGSVRCIAYSPCGRWIASGGVDGVVQLWHKQPAEGESWSCVYTVGGFIGAVHDVAWNPVSPLEFVTGSLDGPVRVWKVSYIGERMSVRMMWSTNNGTLCGEGAILEGVSGLSPMNRKLLTQRGAVDSAWVQRGDGSIECKNSDVGTLDTPGLCKVAGFDEKDSFNGGSGGRCARKFPRMLYGLEGDVITGDELSVASLFNEEDRELVTGGYGDAT